MGTVTTRHSSQSWRSSLKAILAASLGCGLMPACSNLLDVDLPTKVSADALEDPALAQALVNSAIGEFECAFANYVPATGELTDELRHSSGWLVMTVWDERKINEDADNGTCNRAIGHGVYIPLQKARFSAEDTRRRLEAWTDAQVADRAKKIATVTAYAGYARTFLGEAFCEMAIDVGPKMTPAEVLQSAEQLFGDAITQANAAGLPDIANMARVGRARVRLNLGNKAGARQDALLVPAGFRKSANYSAADLYRYNWTYQHNYIDAFISVSNEFLNVKFGGVPDPRVKAVLSSSKAHNLSDLWLQTNYTSPTSPIAIASWEEAQLIIAEVDLGQNAVNIINALHTAVGLPPYAPTNVGDNAEILRQVIEERSRQLYLEGHRLNDFLRHKIPFATGPSPYTGVVYGPTTCLPLPRSEKSGNPNL